MKSQPFDTLPFPLCDNCGAEVVNTEVLPEINVGCPECGKVYVTVN